MEQRLKGIQKLARLSESEGSSSPDSKKSSKMSQRFPPAGDANRPGNYPVRFPTGPIPRPFGQNSLGVRKKQYNRLGVREWLMGGSFRSRLH